MYEDEGSSEGGGGVDLDEDPHTLTELLPEGGRHSPVGDVTPRPRRCSEVNCNVDFIAHRKTVLGDLHKLGSLKSSQTSGVDGDRIEEFQRLKLWIILAKYMQIW